MLLAFRDRDREACYKLEMKLSGGTLFHVTLRGGGQKDQLHIEVDPTVQ